VFAAGRQQGAQLGTAAKQAVARLEGRSPNRQRPQGEHCRRRRVGDRRSGGRAVLRPPGGEGLRNTYLDTDWLIKAITGRKTAIKVSSAKSANIAMVVAKNPIHELPLSDFRIQIHPQ
jgi:hypothetical protein